MHLCVLMFDVTNLRLSGSKHQCAMKDIMTFFILHSTDEKTVSLSKINGFQLSVGKMVGPSYMYSAQSKDYHNQHVPLLKSSME